MPMKNKTPMRRRNDKLAAVCVAISLLCLIVIVGVAGTVLDQNTKLRATNAGLGRTITRLEQASLGVCLRLQLQRERSNLSDARQFLILRQVLRSPQLTKQARREYKEYVDSTEYGPPTDCSKAIGDPPNYVAPAFVPFEDVGPGYAREILRAAKAKEPQPVPDP